MIKALLWDMDGVLLDSEPLHDKVLDIVLAHYGKACTEEDRIRFMGTTSDKMWATFKEEYNIDAPIEDLINMQWEKLIELLPTSGIPASTGLNDVLKYAKENGIISVIVSSSRRDFIETVLNYLGVSGYFDFIVDGFKVKAGKPAPDIYNLAMETGGFKPEECLIIEDSTNGVGAAVNAGVKCIGYDNPTSEGQDISPANYIVKNLGEIVDILKTDFIS